MIFRTVNKLMAMGLALSLSLPAMAQDTKWTSIKFEDFGGNGDSDPLVGAELGADVINPNDFAFDSESYGGDYCVLKHTDGRNNWHIGADHTYPDDRNKGYFVQVNPNQIDRDVNPNVRLLNVYRYKLEGICPGVTFRFSAWMCNLMLTSGTGKMPMLSIGIYEDADATRLVSTSAYKEIQLNKCSGAQTSFDWEQLSFEFQMNSNQSYAYFIVAAVEPEASGFDFGIDDISIEVKQPEVKVTNLDEFEFGQDVQLKATFANNGFFADLSALKYTWEYSADGVSYSAVGSGNPYVITSFNKDIHNGYYRVKIAERGNEDSKVCSLLGEIQVNETKNKKNVHLCETDVVEEVDGTVLDASQLVSGQDVPGIGGQYTYTVTITKSTVLPESESTNKYVCVGETYNGVVLDTEGQKIDISETIKSKEYPLCDSLIIEKYVVVTGPTTKPLPDKKICQGETYNNVTYDLPGTFEIKTQDGCVEYVQNVVVTPTYSINKSYKICDNSVLELTGKTYTAAGSPYSEVVALKTKDGCDSIIYATIEVTSKIEVELDPVTLCEGDEPFVFGGKTYTAPGVYDLKVTEPSLVSGCDSTTLQHLEIYAAYSNEAHPIDTTICYDSRMFGVLYSEPTTTPIKVKDPTVYKTIHGCDSSVYYNLTVLQIQLSLAVKSERTTVCRGEEVEIDVAKLVPENTPLAWTDGYQGSSKKAVFTPTEDLICVVKARNEQVGCETTDTVRVYVRNSPILTIDSVDQKENVVTYHVDGGEEPYKYTLDKTDITAEANGELKDSYIGTHFLSVTDQNDCSSVQRFDIVPVPITPSTYLSPNGDGVNDRWTIENIDVYEKARVRIYTRDGKIIKEYNSYNNDEGWDGTYNGHMMPATDYWYEINLPEVDTQYVGHFTLLYPQ